MDLCITVLNLCRNNNLPNCTVAFGWKKRGMHTVIKLSTRNILSRSSTKYSRTTTASANTTVMMRRRNSIRCRRCICTGHYNVGEDHGESGVGQRTFRCSFKIMEWDCVCVFDVDCYNDPFLFGEYASLALWYTPG